MDYSVPAIIISVVTLLVTIIGWFFTYTTQLNIQDKQIEANRFLGRSSVFLPRRIAMIDNALDWMANFYSVWSSLYTGYRMENVGEARGALIEKILMDRDLLNDEQRRYLVHVTNLNYDNMKAFPLC